MLVRYRDINTHEIKVGFYFHKDYTLNQTRLVDRHKNQFIVSDWQLIKGGRVASTDVLIRSLKLLDILISYTNNVEQESIVFDAYEDMFLDGMTEDYIETSLINALSAGVNHGNWPWVISKSK
jgi:hypothetical protein